MGACRLEGWRLWAWSTAGRRAAPSTGRCAPQVQPGELAGCVPLCGSDCACLEAKYKSCYMQRNIAPHLNGREDVLFAHADMWLNLDR